MAALAEHDHENLCQVELSCVFLGDISIGIIINTYYFIRILLCCKAISIGSSLNRAIIGPLHRTLITEAYVNYFFLFYRKGKTKLNRITKYTQIIMVIMHVSMSFHKLSVFLGIK